MLCNVSTNLLSNPRLDLQNRSSLQLTSQDFKKVNRDSVFLNNDRIILPMKQYSNKFLRQNKPREELIYNQSILKPKLSFLYSGKSIKNRRSNVFKKNKQNEFLSKSLKTESSLISTPSQILTHSVCGLWEEGQKKLYSQTPIWINAETPVLKMERISTSRALEMYSKVFRNDSIDRIKIKREVHSNTSNVQVRQVTLQDKEEKKKISVGVARKPNIHPISSIMQRKNRARPKIIFKEGQDFELVGW